MSEHLYQITVQWTGNTGEGTKDYRAYTRDHLISSKGKPDLLGSSDPMFRGDATRYNPEELLLAALSSCHMLWFLHLCSDRKITVVEYVDQPTAVMLLDATGTGRFTEATLHPSIVITDKARADEAEKLHEIAHKKCFIANSINFPTKIVSSIK
jgi:organic hydroperoxide reductase OsmC/OhrA